MVYSLYELDAIHQHHNQDELTGGLYENFKLL